MYIDHSLLLTSLSDGIIFFPYDSYRVYTIIGNATHIYNPVQEEKKHTYFT